MRKLILTLFYFLGFLFLHSQTPPTVYVAGDGSGDFNCDGINDQEEINLALDFVATHQDYSTVYLKGQNTYWISEPILIASNTILTGDSTAIVRVIDYAGWTENEPMIAQKGCEYWPGGINESDLGTQIYGLDKDSLTNVEISGFELTAGNQSAETGSWYYILMIFHLVKNIKIHDMYLHDSYGDFIRIMGTSWTISQNAEFYNNKMEAPGHDALYIVGISNIMVYKNQIYHTRTNDGIRLEECRNVFVNDNIIGNNTNELPSGYAGILLENDGVFLENAEISYNFIYGKCGAIVLEGGPTKDYQLGVHIHHNKIFRIFDNTASDADFLNGGIHIFGAHNTLIEFNTIVGSQKDGIIFELGEGTDTGYQTYVQNNIITDCENFGINNLSSENTFILEYNDIYNCESGYYNNANSNTDIHLNPLLNKGIETTQPDSVDFHLKSEAGRWNGFEWVEDDITSPCIDAANPLSNYENEPLPNGGRANIGAYGNTNEASKSISSGIHNKTNKNVSLIYPNPTSEKVVFPKVEKNKRYRIINSIGQVVREGKIIENNLDIGTLSKGVYFIQIFQADRNKYKVYKVMRW